MSVIATAVKHLIAAGVAGDALVAAIEEMEAAGSKDAAAEKRRAWDRQRKAAARAAKLSTGSPPDRVESADIADNTRPLSPSLPLPPQTPQTPTHPHTPTRPKNAPARKGTRIGEDFEPQITGKTAEMVKRWPPGRLDREVAQFRDHYAKTGGERGLSLDWQASLRTWLRNADDRISRNGPAADNPNGLGRTARAAIDVFGARP